MDKEANRKPTSFDVARLAGVSRSAVSRAYTPGANISSETREKVNKAATELGYRVNSLARGLQQKHSGIVGVVTARLDTPLRSRQVRLLCEGLIRAGFKPMLLTVEHPKDLGTLIESLISFKVAGIIVTDGSPPRALVDDCRRLELPVVLVNRAGLANWGDRVVADNDEGGKLAVKMLVDCGARRLGCVMPRIKTYSVSGRATAFIAAAKTCGLPCKVIYSEEQGYHQGRAALKDVGRSPLELIDGLFCSTDLIALGALDALRIDMGFNVPDDIQVLGFDDIEQAEWASHDLSTIRQDVHAQIDAVLQLLTDRIADNTLPIRVTRQVLSPVFRGTTRQSAVGEH